MNNKTSVHLTALYQHNRNKKAFQYDAYRPLADPISGGHPLVSVAGEEWPGRTYPQAYPPTLEETWDQSYPPPGRDLLPDIPIPEGTLYQGYQPLEETWNQIYSPPGRDLVPEIPTPPVNRHTPVKILPSRKFVGR